MSLPIVSHRHLADFEIPLAFETKLPLMLRGAPGVGKSQAFREWAEQMKIGFIDTRALYLDPTDVKGFPSIDKKAGCFEWLPPADFPLVGNSKCPEEGIWLFDELPAAAPAVQAALFQIINERRIGPRKVKPGWLIVAGGNRLKDKAVVNRMPSPMVSRLRHIELQVTPDEWAAYALSRGLLPELAAFFRFRPALLNSFDPAKWEHDTPYCCPRTAEFLSRTISAWLKGLGESGREISRTPPLDLCTGWLGEGVATELYAFIEICNTLPAWDEIVRAPASFKMPKDNPGHMYALSCLIARKATAANADVIFKVLNRDDFPDENGVHVVHDIFESRPPAERDAFTDTPAFAAWAAQNTAMFNKLNELKAA